MLFFISSVAQAHSDPASSNMSHSISLGYQYRSLVPEENFLSKHCSSMQYGQVYTFNTEHPISFFINPGITVVGVNQSIIQTNVSLIMGFQFGKQIQIGSGPIVHFRDNESNPFFPQLQLQATYIINHKGSSIPLTISYVPPSYSLTQYQVLIGYTWVPKEKK